MEKRSEILKIIRVFDETMDEFIEDHQIIFDNDIERLKLKFDQSILQLYKPRAKSCIYRDCSNIAIEHSHTIQKSTSLNFISEHGHVYSPRVDRKSGKIHLKKIGVNNASTFPGFCEDHEQLFESFEKRRDLKKPMDFNLQIFRTLCSEISRNVIELEVFRSRLEQYKKFRNSKLKKLVNSKVSMYQAKYMGEFKDLQFTNLDRNQAYLEKEITKMEKYINGFLSRFHDAILNDLNLQNDSQTSTFAVDCDVSIPMCLAGVGNFQIENINVYVIINVIPYQKNSYVILSSLKEYENQIESYLQYHSRHPLSFINMIESWMIYGTDHWFLRPSVWDKIKPRYQEEILNDFFNSTYNIWKEYKYSIFNSTKDSIIRGMLDCIDDVEPEAIDLLKNETSKFTSKHFINYPGKSINYESA